MAGNFLGNVQQALGGISQGLMSPEQEQTQMKQEILRKQTFFGDAIKAVPLLEQGNFGGIADFYQHRADTLGRFKGASSKDSIDIANMARAAQNGDPAAIEQLTARLGQAASVGSAMGLGAPKGAGFTLGEGQKRFDAKGNVIASGGVKSQDGRGTLAQVQSSQILPNGSTVQVFKDGSTRVTGPEGAVLKGADRAQAIIDAQEFGVDVQSRRAGGREGATGVEKRASELITRGISAAESTATIRRAIGLLDAVETGGIAAIGLATRQRLGIEGADEGELSNSLGKSVLSQLRETFGAAFTQTEGERLERIEAGFGKSVATNKRLLSQALRIAERTAKRARRSAEERGNAAEVADIDDLLSFSLSIDDLPAGLPSGTVDNGDGTFTLSSGEVVRRK